MFEKNKNWNNTKITNDWSGLAMGAPFPYSVIRVEQSLIEIKIYSGSKINILCELNTFQ